MVTATSGEELLRLQGLQGRAYPFVIEACKALQRGDVVAGLRRLIMAGVSQVPPDGMTPTEQLAAIHTTLETHLTRQAACWHYDVLPQLQAAGIQVCAYSALQPAQRVWALMRNLRLEPADVYTSCELLGLGDVMELTSIQRPDLKDRPFTAATLRALQQHQSLFDAIRHHDLLLYHPYDSFLSVVELLHQAARDPHVVAIKQTLYRAGTNSPIVEALLEARQHRKQVAVLVELKARFDEESNIAWARALEDAVAASLLWAAMSSLLLLLTPFFAVLDDLRIQQTGRSQEHDANTNDTGDPRSTRRTALPFSLPCSPPASQPGLRE